MRLDVMIPMIGDVDRVARLKLRDARGGERFGKAREALQIRRGDVRHADLHASGRWIERTHIKIADLIGRK